MRLCLLRSSVTIEDYLRDAKHRRHTHISRGDADVLIEQGFVERLRVSRDVEVLRQVSNSYRFPVRGLSCRVGVEIAMVVERIITARAEGRKLACSEWGWALTWLRQVQMRRPKRSRRGVPKCSR